MSNSQHSRWSFFSRPLRLFHTTSTLFFRPFVTPRRDSLEVLRLLDKPYYSFLKLIKIPHDSSEYYGWKSPWLFPIPARAPAVSYGMEPFVKGVFIRGLSSEEFFQIPPIMVVLPFRAIHNLAEGVVGPLGSIHPTSLPSFFSCFLLPSSLIQGGLPP